MQQEGLLSIDGEKFGVMLIKLSRSASIYDKYARRTIDGNLQREIIGCYVNYELEFAYNDDPIRYDKLWKKLIEPVPFHDIILPKNIGYTQSFKAYIAEVKDNIEYANPQNIYERRFNGLSCSFVSKRPNYQQHI